MLYHPQDAEDATQEVLVKVLARLSSFEGRSSLRTWLYRIVVNHLLNVRRSRVEDPAISFRLYGEELDKTPDLEPPDPKASANLLVQHRISPCEEVLCLSETPSVLAIRDGTLGKLVEVGGE
jgi:RNA polymerase sigma factor (sigma-70 family)